jgi:methionine-rich copper-binding protein CopC
LRAHEKLPAGVYLVKSDQHGIFLEQVEILRQSQSTMEMPPDSQIASGTHLNPEKTTQGCF